MLSYRGPASTYKTSSMNFAPMYFRMKMYYLLIKIPYEACSHLEE